MVMNSSIQTYQTLKSTMPDSVVQMLDKWQSYGFTDEEMTVIVNHFDETAAMRLSSWINTGGDEKSFLRLMIGIFTSE